MGSFVSHIIFSSHQEQTNKNRLALYGQTSVLWCRVYKTGVNESLGVHEGTEGGSQVHENSSELLQSWTCKIKMNHFKIKNYSIWNLKYFWIITIKKNNLLKIIKP